MNDKCGSAPEAGLWSAAASGDGRGRMRGLAVLLLALPLMAQTSGIRAWCNPIDLDYKYNFEQLNETGSRTLIDHGTRHICAYASS